VPGPRTKPPDPPVLDTQVLSINLDVVRLTLHVLAATIWVGGQIVLLALMGPLRRIAPAAIAPAARAYAWVAWPAFAVLVATGVWLIAGAGKQSNAYRVTLMVKMVFVVLSGVGAALHTIVKNPTLKGVWASVGLISGLCVVLLGVSIVEAP
jgi:putative copper export protein